MSENQQAATKFAAWSAAVVMVVFMAGFFTMAGTKLEKQACLVRAYENRIDVDLGKKVCAFTEVPPVVAASPN